jgi:hypothetical protein
MRVDVLRLAQVSEHSASKRMVSADIMKTENSRGRPMPKGQTKSSEAAILSRVIQGSKLRLSPEAARVLLDLAFNKEDRKKMHELAVKNQKRRISQEEERELDSYIRIGRFLDLLSANAAKALKSLP